MSTLFRHLLMGVCLLLSLASPGVNALHTPLELTAQERDWIAAHPLLRVGVLDNLIPIEYLSGNQLRGLSSKYLQLIEARTGLRFEFVNAGRSFTRRDRKDMVINGQIDILSIRRRSMNPADDSGLLYTTPYNTDSVILVGRFGSPPISDFGQIAGKTLVTLRRQPYVQFLKDQAPGLKIIVAENAVDMLELVKDGRADAAVSSEWLLIPYLSRQYQGGLQISGVVPQLHASVSMAVRDDQAILHAILEKVLTSIDSEDRRVIYTDWLADMNLDIPTLSAIAKHYDSELGLVFAMVLLLLVLVWQSRQQRRRALQSEREKAMFLAVMSHEIRSPMNAVLAAVELLERSTLDDQQRHFTGLANKGATTLLRLVDDVLDISRIEAGQFELNLKPVDLLQLVQQEIDNHRLHADEKGLELKLSGESAIAPLLLDDIRLAQVLRNLIANAIKFTDAGRIEVQLQLREGAAANARQLLIRVVDSGIGLSPKALQSLFRPYARARDAYPRCGGTGLGLVFCRRMVKLMRGRLTLSSTLGVGTTVELALPVELASVLDPASGAEEARRVSADAPASTRTLRILVVEDTLANRQVLGAQLEGFGCEAILASDAAQGLALFSQQQVDLVLMDCDLPDQDGYSLASELRELEQNLQRVYCPIVAISALTGNVHQERCFDAGMDGVLSKPIRLAKLQEVIELWCDVLVVQQTQTITSQALELSAIHDEVRTDLSRLLEAAALGDRQNALHAAHRLHGAVLTLEWVDMAAAGAKLEQVLRTQEQWRNTDTAALLRTLVEQWQALIDTTVQGASVK